MHYYQHHIGDFNSATRHMNRLERSIYRDLLDLYYDTEKSLPLDKEWICRKVIAHSIDESTAVEQVLNEFFTKTPVGWYHERCEDEISSYQTNNSQKSQAGKASAAAKALRKQQALNGNSTAVATDVEQTNNGTSTNHEPKTINLKPLNINQDKEKKQRGSRLPIDFVLHDDWIAFCQQERPDLNVHKTFDAFKDYWIAAPKGIKLDWFATWRNWIRNQSVAKQSTQQLTFAERDEAGRHKRYEEMTGKKWPSANVIDALPSFLEIEQ